MPATCRPPYAAAVTGVRHWGSPGPCPQQPSAGTKTTREEAGDYLFPYYLPEDISHCGAENLPGQSLSPSGITLHRNPMQYKFSKCAEDLRPCISMALPGQVKLVHGPQREQHGLHQVAAQYSWGTASTPPPPGGCFNGLLQDGVLPPSSLIMAPAPLNFFL